MGGRRSGSGLGPMRDWLSNEGGYLLHEPDAAAGPYAPKAKEKEKKSGKGKKPGTVKRSGNKRTGKK